jgi:glucose-6-phosphate 1-dehydrogenase
VLGASGDLAKKKTYPALFGLFRNGFLPHNTKIVGYARTKMDHDQYIERVTHYIKSKGYENQLEEFKKILTYVPGQYDDDAAFINLDKAILQSEEERGIEVGKRHRVFYMALPPSVFITVAKGLKKNTYAKQGINRIVVEKPFGHDSESSAHLATELASCFSEEEVSGPLIQWRNAHE